MPPFCAQHDLFQCERLGILCCFQVIKGTEERHFLCTCQNLPVVQVGDVVRAPFQIGGNMGGKENGTPVIRDNPGENL